MSFEDAAVVERREERRKTRAEWQKAGATTTTALEDALLGAHRIATSFGDLSAFRDADVSIAEWALLRVVGDRQEVPLKQISAGAGGISRQRIRKLISDLQSKELLTVGRPDQADKRERTISATASTAHVLANISEQMQTVLGTDEKEKDKDGRRLLSAARSLDKLAIQIRRMQAAERPRRRGKDKVEAAAGEDE